MPYFLTLSSEFAVVVMIFSVQAVLRAEVAVVARCNYERKAGCLVSTGAEETAVRAGTGVEAPVHLGHGADRNL